MKKLLTEIASYRQFTNERNRALEVIRFNKSREITATMRAFLEEVALDSLAAFRTSGRQNPSHLVIENFTRLIASKIREMRDYAYTLAYAGEAEAIGRALGARTKVSLTGQDMMEIGAEGTFFGEDIEARVALALRRIYLRAFDAAELAAVYREAPEEALERILKTFPKLQKVKRPPPLAGRFREAAKPPNLRTSSHISGFIDSSTWQKMLTSYLSSQIKVDRSPRGVIEMGEYDDADDVMLWEIERELTNLFVQTVRQGEIDAGQENGIVDFVVIAVIDDRTCENCCDGVGCVDFNGKTTREVEEMTDGGQSAPPYHPKCRCRIAPATEALTEPVTMGRTEDFIDWLNGNVED